MRRHTLVGLLACLLFVPAALRALDQAAADAPVTYPSVPEDVVPVEAMSPISGDGHRGLGYLRTPPGSGPFPAVVIVHGGLVTLPADRVRELAVGIQASRFLAAGYAVAAITYRSRDHDPQSPVSRTDTLAALDFVRTRRFVDPDSVAVWGCSGGGDLGLEVAAATTVAAVVAEEPATVLFTGVYDSSFPHRGDRYTPGDAAVIYTDIDRHYTAAHRKRTRAKIATINSPLLILQGDQQPLNRFNAAVFIPELRNAGKALEVITYPGEPHCFAFYGAGSRTPRPAAALKAFDDSDRFIRRHLRTQPRRLESGRIRAVPVSQADRSREGRARDRPAISGARGS
jgi:dipeptidyl aminopeptidase/acylaminoacyl peptidase